MQQHGRTIAHVPLYGDALAIAASLNGEAGDKLDICPQCGGSGVGVADTTCSRCDGSGGVSLTQQGENTPVSGDEVERRFWLIVHEPGMVPERKGPWRATDTAKVLREFIAARPSAYLHVLTVGADGVPDIDHGPQVLQMLDGRSMSVGRKHNARTLAAHSAALHPTDPAAIRNAALEEAARVAEGANDGLTTTHTKIAAAIRGLVKEVG